MTMWYGYAAVALLCYGLQGFLYKVSAKKGCNTAVTMFFFMSTVTILAAASFFMFGEKIKSPGALVILSILNAIFFFISTSCTMEGLKIIPANVFYPVIRSSTGLVVLFSLLYFHDSLSSYQWIGIVLSLLVILILMGKGERRRIERGMRLKAVILLSVAFLATATVTVIVKFASSLKTPLAFITLSYGLNIFISLTAAKNFKEKGGKQITNASVIIGISIGIVNFFGFISLLRAFALYRLSIIATLVGLSFIVPILLSMIFYKERITVARVTGVVLAIGAAVLLGI